jgi:hypothetical protein
MNPFLRNVLIIAGVAVLVVLLNQETALVTVGMLLRIAFFIAIAVVAYSFWRDFGRREIVLWPTRAQRVFYSAVALFVVDLGWWFVRPLSGRDALAAIVVGAISIYAAWRTWRDQHTYA